MQNVTVIRSLDGKEDMSGLCHLKEPKGTGLVGEYKLYDVLGNTDEVEML